MWLEYKDVEIQSRKLFRHCIYPAIMIRAEEDGIIACSPECYSQFRKLYHKIVMKYHKNAIHETDMSIEVTKQEECYKVL